jgi:hypothetical protein
MTKLFLDFLHGPKSNLKMTTSVDQVPKFKPSCVLLMTGWNIPLYTLLNKGLVSKNNCPYSKALSEFFSGGSCVPGALAPDSNPTEENPQKLCSICAGNLDSSGKTSDTETFAVIHLMKKLLAHIQSES